MKQGRNCFRQSPPFPLPRRPFEDDQDRDEVFVSQILLDLKPLMSLSESLSNFNWTRRKRRSCLDSSTSTSTHQIQTQITVTTTSAARTTASPDTPLSLSFSLSESDEKPKKRKKEEYVGIIQELNQRKVLLQGEVETVKNCYRKLKKFNSKLKAIRHEVLNSCTRKEEGNQMERRTNFGLQLTHRYRMNTLGRSLPSIADPTAQKLRCSYDPFTARLTSSDNGLIFGPDYGLGLQSHLSGVGIDLNLPAEEMDMDASQPLDVIADQRARFAEARRKRMGIIKIKAMRNAYGINFPVNT